MKYFILILLMINSLNANLEIIVSPSCQIKSISKNEIKKLFMIKKRTIENELITVLDSKDKETYRKFLKEYLNKSPRKMKVYWTRMLFTGKKVAPKKFSEALMESESFNEMCYMTYIESDDKPEKWSVVEIK